MQTSGIRIMNNDLRSWPRHMIEATAFARNGDSTSTYRITNLSAGGALLADADGAEMTSNRDLHLALNLPDLQSIEVAGRVVRTLVDDNGRKKYGIAFRDVDPYTEDLIHNFLLSKLESPKKTRPFVLVVNDSVEIRRTLERELRAIGVPALLTAMPLDAMRLLTNKEVHVDLAIVDCFLGPEDGMLLLKYMEKEFPNVQRILTSEQQHVCQLDLALSFGRAHATLVRPWDSEQLSQLIRLAGEQKKQGYSC